MNLCFCSREVPENNLVVHSCHLQLSCPIVPIRLVLHVGKEKHSGSDLTQGFLVHLLTLFSFPLVSFHMASPGDRSPLAAAPSVPLSRISLPPPTILGFLLTPGTLTGAGQRRRRCRLRLGRRGGGLGGAAEQGRELVGDGPLYLVQQTASGPAAVVGELLEAGNRVHAKEVLVGLLVGQVELADVGFGQDGLEDVVLVWVVDNVLEHLVGVAEPAQLVVVGLDVAVHQQGVDSHSDAMLADESDLVFYLILNDLQGRGDGWRETWLLSLHQCYVQR